MGYMLQLYTAAGWDELDACMRLQINALEEIHTWRREQVMHIDNTSCRGLLMLRSGSRLCLVVPERCPPRDVSRVSSLPIDWLLHGRSQGLYLCPKLAIGAKTVRQVPHEFWSGNVARKLGESAHSGTRKTHRNAP